jgi:phosphoenolpyruvate-protein kinase (PTS system EI component)
MTPGAIGVARQVLSDMDSETLRALARRVLRLPTVEEIEHELMAALGRYSIHG